MGGGVLGCQTGKVMVLMGQMLKVVRKGVWVWECLVLILMYGLSRQV